MIKVFFLNFSAETAENSYGRCARSNMSKYSGHASVRIPLRTKLPFMLNSHPCNTHLRLSDQEHWKHESRYIYTKERKFFKILEDIDGTHENFRVVEIEVEEIFEEVCTDEEFGILSLNMSKLGIFRLKTITSNEMILRRDEIESNAAIDHDPNGLEIYIVMVPQESLRCN